MKSQKLQQGRKNTHSTSRKKHHDDVDDDEIFEEFEFYPKNKKNKSHNKRRKKDEMKKKSSGDAKSLGIDASKFHGSTILSSNLAETLQKAKIREQRVYHQEQLDEYKANTQYNVWPLQEPAFQDLDALLLKAKKESVNSDGDDDVLEPTLSASPLWSMEPRVFALELSNTGKRKYIVSHLGRFLNHYWRNCEAPSRHYYELIRDGSPCRLYFDLEFNKAANRHITGDKSERLLDEFLSELSTEIQNVYKIDDMEIMERKHVVDLDSSTETKFSRHFIIHLLNRKEHSKQQQVLFEGAVECGHFVKQFVSRLAEESATGELVRKGHSTLAECLFVNTKEEIEGPKTTGPNDHNTKSKNEDTTTSSDISGDVATKDTDRTAETRDPQNSTDLEHESIDSPNSSLPSTETNHRYNTIETGNPMGNKTCFIDISVYSRNRLFRLLGSLKYGKPSSAALRIAETNKFPFPEFRNELFYEPEKEKWRRKGIVSPVTPTQHEKTHSDWDKYAIALSDSLVVPVNHTKNTFILPKLSPLSENNHTHRQRGQNTNWKRTKQPRCSMVGPSPFPPIDRFVEQVLGTRHGLKGSIRAWSIDYDEPSSDNDNNEENLSQSIITYQMKGNRWCENIQRSHKSNNIMWTVSIDRSQYWQSCHDPDCRMMSSFRGEAKFLPKDVQDEVDNILLEKDMEVDEEFEQALMSLDMPSPQT